MFALVGSVLPKGHGRRVSADASRAARRIGGSPEARLAIGLRRRSRLRRGSAPSRPNPAAALVAKVALVPKSGRGAATAANSVAAALARIAKDYVPLLASAIVLALATHPGSHPLLGMVGLIPLFWTIHSAAPAVAFRRGAIWGVALAVSVSVFAGGSSETHRASTGDSIPLIVCVLLPFISGLYAWLGARLTRWIGFSPLVLAVGWIGVELVLAALGAKLGILAATQGDGWLMNSFGRVLGFAVIAFVVAFTNAVICSLIRRMVRGGWSEDVTFEVFINAVCLASASFASYLLRVKPARAPPPSLTA